MKKRHVCLMLMLLAAAVALALVHTAPASSPPQERTFDVLYTAEIHDIPAGTKEVSIWLPYPQDDAYQKILKANVTSAYPTKISTGEYGNRILHVAVKNPGAAAIPITMEFTVRRSEHVHNDFTQVSASSRGGSAPAANMKRWLEPDHLVPLDQRIRELSAEVTAGKATELEKARAIYDYACWRT